MVTYEFENVPVEAARHLEKFVPVYPPSLALEKAQDRFVEKSFFQELGIPTSKFTINGLDNGFTDGNGFGFPAVLKTRRDGVRREGAKHCPFASGSGG